MAPVPGDSPKTPAWHVDAARGPSTPSFDHLVGAREHGRCNIEANRLGGFEIDHELILVERSQNSARIVAGIKRYQQGEQQKQFHYLPLFDRGIAVQSCA